MTPPSGEQTVLEHGDHRAVVVEVGGGLRSYEHGGEPVLDGYPEDALADAARGQLLVPWPNRLHTGRYTWDGAEHVLPLDEPDQQNAIHGLARWRSWVADQESASAVTMRLVLRPLPAYPFTLELATRYELGEDGLTVTMSATNTGDAAAPYGCGAHPYVTVGTDLVDEAALQVPAATWLPTGTAQIPVGREPVEGTAYDFREARAIGRTRIDHAFTDLDRGADGRAVLTLTAPGSGRGVSVWVDETFGYLEVFTGDTVSDPARRRQGLGVEPMTCPPDAFRSGEDVIRLEPGATATGTWGIRPS